MIPRGFGHGFSVLSETAVFSYKCDNFYAPALEGGISYDDPVLNIDWHLPKEHIIRSEKDMHHPLLKDVKTNFVYKKEKRIYEDVKDTCDWFKRTIGK